MPQDSKAAIARLKKELQVKNAKLEEVEQTLLRVFLIDSLVGLPLLTRVIA